MKKLNLLVICALATFTIKAQDISDALRYSQDEIQGTARFRALSGAFGALGPYMCICCSLGNCFYQSARDVYG